jgi:hypothetical protein
MVLLVPIPFDSSEGCSWGCRGWLFVLCLCVCVCMYDCECMCVCVCAYAEECGRMFSSIYSLNHAVVQPQRNCDADNEIEERESAEREGGGVIP